MNTHRNTRPLGNVNGIRLVNQELNLVRKGIVRYSARAEALANDVDVSSRLKSARRIERMRGGLLDVLKHLEEYLGTDV
jgi:hypothetical protein